MGRRGRGNRRSSGSAEPTNNHVEDAVVANSNNNNISAASIGHTDDIQPPPAAVEAPEVAGLAGSGYGRGSPASVSAVSMTSAEDPASLLSSYNSGSNIRLGISGPHQQAGQQGRPVSQQNTSPQRGASVGLSSPTSTGTASGPNNTQVPPKPTDSAFRLHRRQSSMDSAGPSAGNGSVCGSLSTREQKPHRASTVSSVSSSSAGDSNVNSGQPSGTTTSTTTRAWVDSATRVAPFNSPPAHPQSWDGSPLSKPREMTVGTAGAVHHIGSLQPDVDEHHQSLEEGSTDEGVLDGSDAECTSVNCLGSNSKNNSFMKTSGDSGSRNRRLTLASVQSFVTLAPARSTVFKDTGYDNLGLSVTEVGASSSSSSSSTPHSSRASTPTAATRRVGEEGSPQQQVTKTLSPEKTREMRAQQSSASVIRSPRTAGSRPASFKRMTPTEKWTVVSSAVEYYLQKIVLYLARCVGRDMVLKFFANLCRFTEWYTSNDATREKATNIIGAIIDSRMLFNQFKYIGTSKLLRHLVTTPAMFPTSALASIAHAMTFAFRLCEQIFADLGYYNKHNLFRLNNMGRTELSYWYKFYKSWSLVCYTIVELHKVSAAVRDSNDRARNRASVQLFRNVCDMLMYFQWIESYRPHKGTIFTLGMAGALCGIKQVWDDVRVPIAQQHQHHQHHCQTSNTGQSAVKTAPSAAGNTCDKS